MNGKKYIDITGQRFGKLTVLHPTDKRTGQGSVVWHCRCDCGNEVYASYNTLRYTRKFSCGCVRKEYDQKLKNHLTHVAGTSIDMLKSKKTPADNTTGCRGVYWIRGRYVAKIVFQKKAYYLGTFDVYEDAVSARKEAEMLLYDEVAAFYERWKARADQDRAWAEENPVQIEVERDPYGRLKVRYQPEI